MKKKLPELEGKAKEQLEECLETMEDDSYPCIDMLLDNIDAAVDVPEKHLLDIHRILKKKFKQALRKVKHRVKGRSFILAERIARLEAALKK